MSWTRWNSSVFWQELPWILSSDIFIFTDKVGYFLFLRDVAGTVAVFSFVIQVGKIIEKCPNTAKTCYMFSRQNWYWHYLMWISILWYISWDFRLRYPCWRSNFIQALLQYLNTVICTIVEILLQVKSAGQFNFNVRLPAFLSLTFFFSVNVSKLKVIQFRRNSSILASSPDWYLRRSARQLKISFTWTVSV